MPFLKDLKDLRRRSRVSIRTDQSSSESTNGHVPADKSSSTLSSLYASTTPPSSIQPNQSSPNLVKENGQNGQQQPPVPQRPPITSNPSNRYSMNGLSSSANSTNGYIPAMPASPYAPRVLSVSENSWVHQKILLIYGQIGDPSITQCDGNLGVSHHHDTFPAISWPVNESHFKALIHLVPGPNRIRLDFTSPKLSSSTSVGSSHASLITVNYLPLVSSPPLQLAILVAKDSPLTYDAVPERVQREGNGLEEALRKFRTAAYLWQAFTGEQMYRNRLGRRCFRLEEEWQSGSLTGRDFETGTMRNEAKVHIIPIDRTVEELRALETGNQMNGNSVKGHHTSPLFDAALEAVHDYFRPTPGQVRYVSALMLDTKWDAQLGNIQGEIAEAGSDGNIRLAVVGSQSLQSYPSCLEEVVSSMSDCTKTDTRHIANWANECGSNWESACSGMGVHLRETGRVLGCPTQDSGVMQGDYIQFNRAFTCREPYSTRTKQPGQRLCLPKDECSWNRRDCLRFRYHPCFSLPSDASMAADEGVQAWVVGNGTVIAASGAGISWVEVRPAGEEQCRSHIEYGDGMSPAALPQQVMLNEADLRAKLAEVGLSKTKRLRVDIFSASSRPAYSIVDFAQFASKQAFIKLPNGQTGYRGASVGNMSGASTPTDLVLDNAMKQTKLLTQIRTYHSQTPARVEGIEFLFEDHTNQLFGQRGLAANDFYFDTRKGEILIGFYVRAGTSGVEGADVLTSLGRRSGPGGKGYNMLPPRGYSVAGVTGNAESGSGIDSFGLIITR